jgi:hypothetical protein
MKDIDLINNLVSLSRDLYHQSLKENKLPIKETAQKLLDFITKHQINPIIFPSFPTLAKQAYDNAQTLSSNRDLSYKIYQLALQLQVRHG